jgi:hypothetical protein
MTQHQAIQLFLPILIILPMLYFRGRKMARAQPLKLNRLWIRPVLILATAALVLVAPSPGHQPAHVLTPVDWAWMALAAALGAVAGWQWGRTMAIEVHPQDGTLMVRGGMAAVLVMAVLVLFRLGMRTGLSVEAQAWHISMFLVSDASIIFTALLFTLRSIEMYFRARRVMALKRAA